MFKLHKKVLFILIIAIIVVLIAILAANFYSTSQKIQIENQSRFYKAEYHSSKKFIERLNQWNIWGENSIRINKGVITYTIKKIKIILSDQKQTLYSFKSSSGDSLWSTNASVSKDTLIIVVNLKKDAENDPMYSTRSKDKILDDIFFAAIVQTLYQSSHGSSLNAANQKIINQTLVDFYKKNEAYPFKVSLLHGV